MVSSFFFINDEPLIYYLHHYSFLMNAVHPTRYPLQQYAVSVANFPFPSRNIHFIPVNGVTLSRLQHLMSGLKLHIQSRPCPPDICAISSLLLHDF